MLFLLALVGVLTATGVVVADLLGPVAAGVYAAVVLTLLALGAARARAAAAAARREAGRTCTCCTGTVHDPVQVR